MTVSFRNILLISFAFTIASCASINPVEKLARKVIFYPDRVVSRTPQSIGLSFEDIYFMTQDKMKLNGWLIKSEENQGTLLFLHGNAGNISHRLDKIMTFHRLGLNVFIIDYRGYGKSDGTPTEQGVYQDAESAYDYLINRGDVDSKRIIVYGESLGGAVAIDLATKRKIAGLIADSTFTSVPAMASESSSLVPGFMINTKMDSIAKVKNIFVPKLFIHSVDDDIIPFYMGKKLFDEAPAPKGFLRIRGGHNDGYFRSKTVFTEGIKDFLGKIKGG